MTKLISSTLVIMFLFFITMAGLMIFYPELVAVFPGTGFTSEEMTVWRTRTVIPAFYLTLCYFIYRYFSGRNPTSTIWPIYIAIIFYLVTQAISMIFTYFNWIQPAIFVFTLGIFFILREAHNRRKNEIFGKNF